MILMPLVIGCLCSIVYVLLCISSAVARVAKAIEKIEGDKHGH